MKTIGILSALILATAASPGICAAKAVGAHSGPRGGQPENRWRYVWHNDHWWYWTSAEHWSYFDGRRWQSYDPRRPLSGAPSTGYRKAPAFESAPAAPPQPSRTWSGEGLEREAGLANSYYLEGGAVPATGTPLGGGPLTQLRGPTLTPGVSSSVNPTTTQPRTGGGAFGGPKGNSLGAGSAVGGASSPR